MQYETLFDMVSMAVGQVVRQGHLSLATRPMSIQLMKRCMVSSTMAARAGVLLCRPATREIQVSAILPMQVSRIASFSCMLRLTSSWDLQRGRAGQAWASGKREQQAAT